MVPQKQPRLLDKVSLMPPIILEFTDGSDLASRIKPPSYMITRGTPNMEVTALWKLMLI